MGQKVNPILFRSGLKKNLNLFSVSPTTPSVFSQLLIQEIEIKKFLSALLRSRGILIRSCKFSRSSEKLCLELDLYFTSLLGKEAKLFWVRSLFKNIKKNCSELDKVKDLKTFLQSSQVLDESLNKIPRKSKLKTRNKGQKRFRQKSRRKSIKVRLYRKGKKIRQKKKPVKKRIKTIANFIRRLKKTKFALKKGKKTFLNSGGLSPNRLSKYSSRRKLSRSFSRAMLFQKLKNRRLLPVLPFRRFRRRKLSIKKFKKSKSFDLVYKRRLFYYLLYKKKKGVEWGKIEEENLFSVNQSHLKSNSDFGRLSILKLYRLFGLRKLKYKFSSLFLRNFICLQKSSKSLKKPIRLGQSLLQLNKLLCQSLQGYCGIEEVSIRLSSAQLLFLPSFKLYKKFLVRKLASLKRNRDLKNFFIETVELFYFVLGSFGRGNASLVAKYISRLLERTRKQLLIVKFLKKCLQLFFEKIPKSFFAVEGIRILMKGRFNKRRRTKKIVISQGQISLQTLDTCLDYAQTQAVTLYGSFGIKVWISKRRDSSFN